MLIHISFLKVCVFIFAISGKKKRSVFSTDRCQTGAVFVCRTGFFWLLTPCKIIIWWRLFGKRRCFYFRVKEQALTPVLFLWFWFATILAICLSVREMHVSVSCVSWTVHHLDSWIKRDQLDVPCFIISLFNVQHVSDVNTSILRSLRLICWVVSWVVLLWFDVCWCYVVVWLWWCGIRMQAEALVLQPLVRCVLVLHMRHMLPTHIEPEQCNPCNNSTHKTQAAEDGCINIRNMLSIK